MWRHRAQQRSTPVKREAVVAGLASESLALVSGRVGTGSSEFLKMIALVLRVELLLKTESGYLRDAEVT